MHHQTAIGIMDEAYFCPRQEIIRWVNSTLQLNIEAIEDLGTGAVYCQLLDYAFGQRVPMQKINWKAKFEYEFINNLKVFQNSMQRLGITRKFDIQRLSKAKYQDNLETIQWLKRYIELNGNLLPTYNPVERRNHADLYSISQAKKILGNPFKSVTPLANNNSQLLNQSLCSTTILKPRMSLKPRLSVTNKENNLLSEKKTKKPLKPTTKESEQLNEIKKVLLSSDDSDTKISDINRIVFGLTEMVQCEYSSIPIDVQQAQQDEDEVLVF